MAKVDLSSVVEKVQKLYKSPQEAASIGLGSSLKTLSPENFLKMDDWWQEATNTPGVPFGGYVMLAGDSDSGKTTAAIEAMKAAQKQDMTVLYVEAEGKTTEDDLANRGVATDGVMLVAESIAEYAYTKMFQLWEAHKEKYPDRKIFPVIDSIGSLLSIHDSELDISEKNSKPGGKGKTNRLAVNKLIAKARKDGFPMLILNYTYDNIGSPGKTNAGGKALNFFSSLTYQTSRKQWLEKTVNKQKVRIGARVQWRLFKNHIDKANPGHKVVELDITSDGIVVAGTGDE